MGRKASVLPIILLAGVLAAESLASPSAVRHSGEGYREALRRVAPSRGWSRDSAPAVAGPVHAVDWARAPVLSTSSGATFRAMRDMRFLRQANVPEFPRRVAWLYPADGCYARAGAVVALSDRLAVERPAQLFAFGELRVTTPNVAEGYVQWWYHVAAVYRDRLDRKPYVFDPSIDPSRPLPVETWLLRMVPSLDEVQVALCQPTSMEPSTDCDEGADDAVERMLLLLRDQFLPSEWTNLLAMGRNPQRELGDAPPWLTGSSEVTSPIDRTARKASWTVMSNETSFSSSTSR